jgi:hypothetical protein
MKPPTLNTPLTNSLTSTIKDLSSSLKTFQPVSLGNSETTQIITYALIATAVMGIFVYHYIKEQEQTN